MYGLNTLLLYLLFSHHLEWLGNNLTQIKDKTKASLVVSFSAKVVSAKYTKSYHMHPKKAIILVSRVRLAEYPVLRVFPCGCLSEGPQESTEEEAPKP